jgi:hypothetical protein
LIQQTVEETVTKLNASDFLKMYHEDGLGHTLKNVDFWIRDTFRTLSSFK